MDKFRVGSVVVVKVVDVRRGERWCEEGPFFSLEGGVGRGL